MVGSGVVGGLLWKWIYRDLIDWVGFLGKEGWFLKWVVVIIDLLGYLEEVFFVDKFFMVNYYVNLWEIICLFFRWYMYCYFNEFFIDNVSCLFEFW